MKKSILLPHWFKIVGITIFLTPFIVLVLIKYTGLTLPINNIQALFITILNLGMFVFAISKDKIEDERTNSLRLIASFIAFGFSTLGTIFNTLLITFQFENGGEYMGYKVVFMSLFMYNLMYQFLKLRA